MSKSQGGRDQLEMGDWGQTFREYISLGGTLAGCSAFFHDISAMEPTKSETLKSGANTTFLLLTCECWVVLLIDEKTE